MSNNENGFRIPGLGLAELVHMRGWLAIELRELSDVALAASSSPGLSALPFLSPADTHRIAITLIHTESQRAAEG